MKKYFTVFLAFIIYFNVFSQAHAAKNYNVKTIYYDPLEKVINATVLDQIAEKTMRRSAKVPVTASATGSTVASMIRMGIAGAAIYGLIEGVGWIIENGVVKKPKKSEEEFEKGYAAYPFYGATAESATKKYCTSYFPNSTPIWSSAWTFYGGTTKQVRGFNCYEGSTFKVGDIVWKLTESTETTEYIQVPDADLGEKINNSPQAPEILPTVYNPNNPAGGKAPQDTSDALDRAVPVPETDPTGSTEVNPETGKGTFKLPAFCEWASVMCAWYQKYQEDSKKTDQHREQEKDVWSQEKTARDEEKTARQEEKQHRDEEKSFWEKVTDWFDWTKEEPDDKEEPEQPEIDDKGIFSRTFDTVFSLSKQCPPDLPWSIDAYYFKGSYSINLNWLCMIFTFLGYPLVLASHCVGLWIMYEAVIRKEIKW